MSMLVNKKSYAHILFNTECLFYKIITSCFTRNHNLQCMKIKPCTITRFDESSDLSVDEVTVIQININRHQKSRTFFYIVFKLAFYDLILSLSWMKQNEIILNTDRVFLMIEFIETVIWNRKASAEDEFNHIMMSVMFFSNLIQKKEEKQKKIEVFSANITDIERVNNGHLCTAQCEHFVHTAMCHTESNKNSSAVIHQCNSDSESKCVDFCWLY